ncbi:helix-turn-helix domain-containing protein [Cognatiluteimonas weifangensis]|uniref:helix-turn-helix domain-containing protein n=1 Tax=Cognatiluteimonas weifangensis TaxID=2303539 RepID=UPI003CCD1C7B
MMQLGDRIKSARERACLSQAELASQSGITQQSLSNLERGKSRSLNGDALLQMARALGCSPDWLVYGDGASSSDSAALREDEQLLLSIFRGLGREEKRLVVRLLRGLTAASES